MRRSGIAQEQMRKTAQTFSRCSALASLPARRRALHRGGDDDAAVGCACLRMLLTGTSRTCERTRRACARQRVRCRVHVRLDRPAAPRRMHATTNTSDRANATPLADASRSAARAAAIGRRFARAPDCDAHHRDCQKTDARFAAIRCRCSGVAFQHLATTACASIRAARPASSACRLASVARSVARVVPARRYVGHSETCRAPDRQTSRTIESALRFPLPSSFVPRKRKPAAQGGRFGCRDEAARLSGRLPRAARRSRPGSAARSTAPGRRSPARRSSLRRRRPR
ncbi:hypothetical protein XTPLMG730_2780 [Xanthomonas translucens pv. phlei]|uniref:Uncharacterized protein n=1 Tax=Xanthomonas graminis pv. phlei TaxID=487906 RepID=A0A0K2ZXE2_9XANT|nr:hypothetical protein XTPLMG730_2780 [Xanthomonas translucens pv. phlei]